MEAETYISVRNLNVFYDKVNVLKNINLNIPDKKLTAIIGPSGCGKTTLLKSFNRLLDTTKNIKITGSVIVDGENIYNHNVEVTHIRKKMGLLFQRPFPLPMSIFDNVAYGMRIHGLKNKQKLAELVEHYLRAVTLWDEVKDRLKNSASSLSIGQQQRLCLARGLAVEPQVILADEPTSALDIKSSSSIEDLFLNLKKKYTIIMVTHMLRQAYKIADHIVFMNMGEIIEQGPTVEFFENPKKNLTREYVLGFKNETEKIL